MSDTGDTTLPPELRELLQSSQAAQARGNLTEALRLMDEAVARWPGNHGLWSQRGLLQEGLQRPEDALASFRRSVALRPTYGDHYNAGNMLLALGRLDEAVTEFDASISCRSDYPEAWVNRGISFFHLGRAAEAGQSFARALALQHDFAPALSCDALLAEREGDLERARERWRVYCGARPEDAAGWHQYGRALGRLPPNNAIDAGLHRRAVEALQRARALAPDSVGIWVDEAYVRQRLLHTAQVMARMLGPQARVDFEAEARSTLAFFQEACERFPDEEALEELRADARELTGAG